MQVAADALNCAANGRKKFRYEIKLVDRSFVTRMTLIFIWQHFMINPLRLNVFPLKKRQFVMIDDFL